VLTRVDRSAVQIARVVHVPEMGQWIPQVHQLLQVGDVLIGYYAPLPAPAQCVPKWNSLRDVVHH
jgi:hypothetical protein